MNNKCMSLFLLVDAMGNCQDPILVDENTAAPVPDEAQFRMKKLQRHLPGPRAPTTRLAIEDPPRRHLLRFRVPQRLWLSLRQSWTATFYKNKKSFIVSSKYIFVSKLLSMKHQLSGAKISQ